MRVDRGLESLVAVRDVVDRRSHSRLTNVWHG
jgi:hypothetical protein